MTAGTDEVTVFGHCAENPQRITDLIGSGQAAALTVLPGDFVIAVTDPDQVTLISSRSGVVDHFYDTRSPLTHGRTVDDVLAAARRPLSWNHEAVADYLAVGHLLGDETLDRHVRRVPAGAVVTLDRDGARVSAGPAIRMPSPTTPDDAVRALRDSVRRAVSAPAGTDGHSAVDCTLSMSGGLDARLLLAALLADGHRPHLLVSGVAGSFDRQVATTIATDLGLPYTVRAVPAGDLDAGTERTARATGGLLPISNWAGMAHLSTPTPPNPPVLLGYHGEFARGYYLPPVGAAALRLAYRGAGHATDHLLRRFAHPFRADEHRRLSAELADALRPAALRARIDRVLPTTGTLARATADFFHTQYGRRKIGTNLAAIGGHPAWRVPYLDPTWTDAVRGLPVRAQLGDRWHRYAISRLWPRLLDYPEQGYGGRTASRPPARYWTRGPRPPTGPFYVDQTAFHGDGAALAALARLDGDAVADLLDPTLLPELLTEQRHASPRPHLCFALYALARWRQR
ncbi:hypothetical protein O7632_16325 [Solwaraspora sp. WMMD406]|uniref:hypothetical protein n=1 Tax=Solwaraspora sp. WMMD406 TaxID=3016095 RepID=UPI00241804B9|nr:hypothetical protein [Solwaraspora sp. WMMD406]MDG4765653.1 hypothetical protein [Solwaraspora sp. WMMD406]